MSARRSIASLSDANRRLLLASLLLSGPAGVAAPPVNPGVAVSRIAIEATTGGIVSATAWVRNSLDNTSNVRVTFQIWSGSQLVTEALESATVPPLIVQGVHVQMRIPPSAIRLWGLDMPHVYRLHTILSKDSEAVEGAYETATSSSFGLRSIETYGQRLLLNGEEIRLAGTGLAMPAASLDALRVLRDSASLINLVGFATPALLDWADRTGVLLIVESDVDEIDFRAVVRSNLERYGHHPSVIAWSFRTPQAPNSIWIREMYAHVRRLDPQRLVTFADSALEGDVLSMDRLPPDACRQKKPVFLRGPSTPEALRTHPCVSGWLPPTKNAQSLSSLGIQSISQANGNTRVLIENRAGFPSRVVRGHQIQVGHQIQKIPTLKTGETLNLEFEQVNPYRIDILDAVGRVVLNQ